MYLSPSSCAPERYFPGSIFTFHVRLRLPQWIPAFNRSLDTCSPCTSSFWCWLQCNSQSQMHQRAGPECVPRLMQPSCSQQLQASSTLLPPASLLLLSTATQHPAAPALPQRLIGWTVLQLQGTDFLGDSRLRHLPTIASGSEATRYSSPSRNQGFCYLQLQYLVENQLLLVCFVKCLPKIVPMVVWTSFKKRCVSPIYG